MGNKYTTKMCVYETPVMSVLLCNTETWCLTATQEKILKVFEMACLRKIEGVTRRDRIRNEEIYRRVGMNQAGYSNVVSVTLVIYLKTTDCFAWSRPGSTVHRKAKEKMD